jgi:hypothetical protein
MNPKDHRCWLCTNHQRTLVEARPKLYYTSICVKGHDLNPEACGSFNAAQITDISLPTVDKTTTVG